MSALGLTSRLEFPKVHREKSLRSVPLCALLPLQMARTGETIRKNGITWPNQPARQQPLTSSVCCKDSVKCLSSFFSCSTPLRHLAVSSSSLWGQRAWVWQCPSLLIPFVPRRAYFTSPKGSVGSLEGQPLRMAGSCQQMEGPRAERRRS